MVSMKVHEAITNFIDIPHDVSADTHGDIRYSSKSTIVSDLIKRFFNY